MLGVGFPLYLLSDGLYSLLVSRHLGLQFFLCLFDGLACLCSDVGFPVRGLPEFIPEFISESAYFHFCCFNRLLCFGKGGLEVAELLRCGGYLWWLYGGLGA